MNRLVQLFALNLHNTILLERERGKKKIAQKKKKKKIDDNSIHTYMYMYINAGKSLTLYICTKKCYTCITEMYTLCMGWVCTTGDRCILLGHKKVKNLSGVKKTRKIAARPSLM